MTAQDQQSRAEFEAWARRACYEMERHDSGQYARNTTEQVWQSWKAARALSATQEAKWFLHTIYNTEGIPGNAPYETVTEDEAHPFGVPGRDFSAEFPVTSQPVFTAAQVLAMGRVPPAAQDLLKEAVSRIKDMLNDDDGQAWKEARKFIDKVEAIGITHPTGD